MVSDQLLPYGLDRLTMGIPFCYEQDHCVDEWMIQEGFKVEYRARNQESIEVVMLIQPSIE